MRLRFNLTNQKTITNSEILSLTLPAHAAYFRPMLQKIIGQSTDSPKDERRPESPAPVIGAPSSIRSPLPVSPQRSTIAPNMTTSKNVLANDVEIKGSIKFSHDLIIDGKIEGEVTSDGSLTVGENALIKGEIKTRSVTLFGKVEGNITVTERCELKSNSTLVGDVSAATLSIEEGATFLGRSQVGKSAPKGGQAPAPAQANRPN